jgi:hypothetical protein
MALEALRLARVALAWRRERIGRHPGLRQRACGADHGEDRDDEQGAARRQSARKAGARQLQARPPCRRPRAKLRARERAGGG